MKIDIFFPFFKDVNAKQCLENFKNSKFFSDNKDVRFVFVCSEDDEKNFSYLSKVVENKTDKLLLLEKGFTYNDAFYYSINYFQGDIVLLADAKIARLDIVFNKCLEKYNKKANVVHIVKKQSGIKGFFAKMFQNLYNIMIKIFTGKKDRCNVISLGLIDKHVMDFLKVLPNKCCFLKNTKNIYGFESRSIYIDAKTKTYKLNFKTLTTSLKMSFYFLGISVGLILILVLLNSLIKTNLSVYNIIITMVVIVFLLSTLVVLPKHFFDIRNRENRKVELKVIEFKVKEEKVEKTKKVIKNKTKKEEKVSSSKSKSSAKISKRTSKTSTENKKDEKPKTKQTKKTKSNKEIKAVKEN